MKRELIEITEKIRIENGPKRKTCTVTDITIDDEHSPKRYKLNGKDAFGKDIVLGAEFTFLDDKGPWGWYVYIRDLPVKQKRTLKDVLKRTPSKTFEDSKWQLYKIFDTKQEAVKAAEHLKEATDGIS